MSEYRNSLNPAARAKYEAAILAAAQTLAAARAERELVAASEGAAEVALRALTPGGPSAEAVEARYLELQAAARKARAA